MTALKNCFPINIWILIRTKKNAFPLFPHQFLNEKAVIEYTSHLLKGTFSALASRYELIQPLTAGWGLSYFTAASKKLYQKMKYYTFDSSHGEHMDVRIPLNLSQQLGLTYECVRTQSLRDDFLKKDKKEHIMPRILPKTANIQYHYDCQYHPGVINVNGNGAEVVRCFYGHSGKGVTLNMLFAFSGYNRDVPILQSRSKNGTQGQRSFLKDLKFLCWICFTGSSEWETGGALFPHEQDIAVEEVSPFNNVSFLISVLSVKPERRKSPHFSFFLEI